MYTKAIKTENAPAAVGPYSQAIKLGDFVYLSGALPIDPKTNEVITSSIEDATRMVMSNIKGVLDEMGLEFRHVVKTTCFLDNMDNFAAFNKVYAEYFKEPYPARSCVEVSRLPKNVMVEVECMVIDTTIYERVEQCNNCSCDDGCNGCSGCK